VSQAFSSDEMRVQITALVEPQTDRFQPEVPTQSHALVRASFTGLDGRLWAILRLVVVRAVCWSRRC
jgi:hypothetical protein